MRKGQSVGPDVLGYAIERCESQDGTGAPASAHYQIRCPRTGSVIGRADSLRMARRFVLMHELRDFGGPGQEQRPLAARFAA